MATKVEAIDVSLSYANWLAQQQQNVTTLQTHFDDGSSVVFSVVTHETAVAGTAPPLVAGTEVTTFD